MTTWPKIGGVASPDRPRLLAESAARVYEITKAEALADVARGAATGPQAFARIRRKYNSLERSYFAREAWERSQAAWDEHGPHKSHRDAYARLITGTREA